MSISFLFYIVERCYDYQPFLLYYLFSFVVLIFCFWFVSWTLFYIRRQRRYDRYDKIALKTSNTISPVPALTTHPCKNLQKFICGKQSWWWQARIYQIIIDRFNGWKRISRYETFEEMNTYVGGTLEGVIKKLDYIKNLGYNTILFSPVFSSAAYHGYHTISYENIDEHFGDWDDFKEMVDIAHQKGMRVICDYVPNHCHIDHPFFQKALKDKDCKERNWFLFNAKDSTDYTPFLHYKELPKFNLYNQDVADYMIQVAERLVGYKIDGLRIDHVIGLPFCFLQQLRERIKSINSDVFIFGEATASGIRKSELPQIEFKCQYLREQANRDELTIDALQQQYVDVIDGVLDFGFRDIIIPEIEAGNRIIGNINLIRKMRDHLNQYPSNFALVLFLDNHDLDRFMYYCKNDKSLLDEALTFMNNYAYPSSVYYGTEQYMTNDPSIINAEPYADLRVRRPMNWKYKTTK